jgi:hypothetical protein
MPFKTPNFLSQMGKIPALRKVAIPQEKISARNLKLRSALAFETFLQIVAKLLHERGRVIPPLAREAFEPHALHECCPLAQSERTQGRIFRIN